MHIRLLLFALGWLAALPLVAQPPAPAPPQTAPVVLSGGTVHVGDGTVIENGAVAFAAGKITYVGPASGQPADMEVISVRGQHVYPGLILPNTPLGLVEINAVRATDDQSEVGPMNPNVRALIAYNTDSDITPTVRSNGVLIAQVTPRAGLVRGQSAIVHLDAWNWEEAAIQPDDGLHIAWPAIYEQTGWWAEPGPVKKNEGRAEEIRALHRLFSDARAYQAQKPAQANLKLAAMRGLFDGEKRLYLHTDGAREMVEAVRFAQQHGVGHPVIVGGHEAYLITDFLKENDVPVLLTRLHRLPHRPEEDVWQPYKTPGQLHAAGVRFGLNYQGDMEPMGDRNLPFVAGTAAGYGLDREAALRAITLSNAEILGIDDRLGSLAVGKDATLVVSTGDLLDMATHDVRRAYISGRLLDLDDKQKRLNEKFGQRYDAPVGKPRK